MCLRAGLHTGSNAGNPLVDAERMMAGHWSGLFLRPDSGAEYCDERVCLSVSEHILGTTRLIFTTKFFVHVTDGRGSVLFWQRSDVLHISSFVGDVIFAHKLIGCSTSPPG